jgi:hypothetical protein
MTAALAALLIASPAAALADPSVAVSVHIGGHRNDAARCVNPIRISMYGAQVADAFTASAAAEHRGISRTPFGASPALTYVAEQGALDLIVGALTRRWPCGSKNLIDGAIGASAASNAFQNGATK